MPQVERARLLHQKLVKSSKWNSILLVRNTLIGGVLMAIGTLAPMSQLKWAVRSKAESGVMVFVWLGRPTRTLAVLLLVFAEDVNTVA